MPLPGRSPLSAIIALAATIFFVGCRTPQAIRPVDIFPAPVPPIEGGREYWMAFQRNFRDFTTDDKSSGMIPADPIQLELFITSSEATTGYVEIPGLGFRKEFAVAAGKVTNVVIDTAAQARSSGRVEKLGVHVVAVRPVVVYGLDRRFQTTDTYIAYPNENLGTRYRAICFRWLQNDLLAQFAVVATGDSTRVTIHPSAAAAVYLTDSSAAEAPKPVTRTDTAGDFNLPHKTVDTARRRTLKPAKVNPRKPAKRSAASRAKKAEKRAPSAETYPYMVIHLRRGNVEGKDSAAVLEMESSHASAPVDLQYRSSIYRRSKLVMPGDSLVVTLNRGDVYQVIARYDPSTPCDLSGSLIESDKPVAVFSGHNCAYVPDPSVKACNLLVEEMPPIDTWGRQFFVGTLAGRSSSLLRVLADKDSTHVFENNKLVATLNAGQFYENKNQTQHTMITSDQPVLVAQYSKGFDNGDDAGDPMMIVIAPTEQYSTRYRFTTPVRGHFHHYVNIATPAPLRDSIRLNGALLADSLFRPVYDSTYYIGTLEVPYGSYLVSCPGPFSIYNYGLGYDDAAYDAYGNAGSYTFRRK